MANEVRLPVSRGNLVNVSNCRRAYRYDPIEGFRRIHKSEIIEKNDGKSYVIYDLTSPDRKEVCLNDEFAMADFSKASPLNDYKVYWTTTNGFRRVNFRKEIETNPNWTKIPLDMLNRNLTKQKTCTLVDKGSSPDRPEIWASKWGQIAMAIKEAKTKEVKDVVFLDIRVSSSCSKKEGKESSITTCVEVTLPRMYWSFKEDPFLKASSKDGSLPGICISPEKVIVEAFNRYRPNPKCNTLLHADGDPLNCCLSNLIWSTGSPQDACVIVKMYENIDPMTRLIRSKNKLYLKSDAYALLKKKK